MDIRKHFKLSSFIPALMAVCLISFVIRGVEVWTGFKSISGAAYAVESVEDAPPPMPDKEADVEKETMKMAEADMKEGDPKTSMDKMDGKEAAIEEDDELDELGDDLYTFSPAQTELARDLVKQRKKLETREKELLRKEALLAAAEKELDQKYQELVSLRRDLEDLLQQQSEAEEERINSLVKIYEGMKAKQAANIFNTLDLDILVNVISRMSERKSAPILAAMSPERARTVTILLAEQKQLPTLPVQ